jgi:uncharacterized membrane protein
MSVIRRRQARDESGQLTVLLVVFAATAMGFVLVAVDASMVFLGRQRLASAVDAAAVRAAQQFDQGGYFAGSCVRSVPLDAAKINGVLAAYETGGVTLAARESDVDGGPGVIVDGTLSVNLPDVPLIGVGSWVVKYQTRARSSISGTPCGP